MHRSIMFNFMIFLVLLWILPYNLGNYYKKDKVKTFWLSILFIFSIISFSFKLIIIKKFKKPIMQSIEEEFFKKQLIEIFSSKVAIFNQNINNFTFFTYLFGTTYAFSIQLTFGTFNDLD
jgi:hypothetical protein